ncbi:UDP-glycosyltransferase UGT5-like [Phlebotomus papatasi]|uniref:UDP-glycosyltransferase UGT5-like n=1 Tax=Phlebotomus papatasi TaxID=29031 RepID=UPI0024834FFB|nr:UDP-glycosyltransferase UGT5-like [Phlebotomus papatasi]
MRLSVVIVVFLPCLVNCANILFLETVPSPSHHIWIRTLSTALAERGHNITSLSTDIEEHTPENLHYLHLDKVYDVMYNQEDEDFGQEWDFFEMGKINSYLQLLIFMDFTPLTLKGSLKSTGFHQLLAYPDDFKFDLIIYDFMVGGIMLPFVQKFNNPPVIALTAFYSVEFGASIVGGTLNPSFIPYIVNHDGDLTSFFGRVNNFVLTFLDYFLKECYMPYKLNALLRKEMPWAKDIRELNQLAKIVLLNKHPGLDIIEPAFPNVISVGGMQIQRNKGLPQDLQEVLDNSKDGVILLSLGTNVKSAMLGDDRITEILETFRSLPQYTFIWKFEADSLPVEVPSNVIIRKFVPQSDLLEHPNLKLFISHCGLLSTQEAIWFGVPILGLPVFGDQFHNLKLSLKNGVAEEGNLGKIDRMSFQQLIEKMLKDPKYRNNAETLSQVFRDQKETPLERAIWWTEYVLRHPNMTYMRSSSFELGIIKRQSWDVMAFIFSMILISMFVFVKISCCVCRMCSKKKSRKPKRD